MKKTTQKLERKIAIIGLGYVGLPVALAFGKKQAVIAFDINSQRIEELKAGIDVTREVKKYELQQANLYFSSDPNILQDADFFIVAVPSPINQAKQPDFSYLISASTLLAPQLKSEDIVVYESTVYPGATEERCIPVLEEVSGLKSGKDFFVGYSPERINPGDQERTFTSIKKVVSAQTEEALDIIAHIYSRVVVAGVHKVSSIRVAEAAKVIENTQRDINIALINELALIFNRLGLDTEEVLTAAGTKWNFLPFKPGLVGGHCIGVDPYYLTHKAIECGVHPEVILAGRRINDNMGKYIALQTIKQISQLGKKVKEARIGIMGLTFKENCPDIRNSKVIDIITELNSYHANVLVYDPLAHRMQVKKEYAIEMSTWNEFNELDAIILAVAHDEFKQIAPKELSKKLVNPKLLMDVKSMFVHQELKKENIKIWRL